MLPLFRVVVEKICYDKEIFGKPNQMKLKALMMKSCCNSCKWIILDGLKQRCASERVGYLPCNTWPMLKIRSEIFVVTLYIKLLRIGSVR